MTHMLEAIPESAETIPGSADGFVRWLREVTEAADVDLGSVDTVGHLMIARNVTRTEISNYVSELGDPFVSDSARSGVVPGDYAVITDGLGFVYGYRLTSDAMVAETIANAERIESEWHDS